MLIDPGLVAVLLALVAVRSGFKRLTCSPPVFAMTAGEAVGARCVCVTLRDDTRWLSVRLWDAVALEQQDAFLPAVDECSVVLVGREASLSQGAGVVVLDMGFMPEKSHAIIQPEAG